MELFGASNITSIMATTILLVGVMDDLRSKKFHNWLFLACSAVALATVLVASGVTGMPMALLGFVAGIIALLPFVQMGMIGAGDMKLMAAFGIVAGWTAVVNVAIFALVWGALFGVFRVIAKGQLKSMVGNMVAIVTMKERTNLELHTMPFTFALMMGWLSHLVYVGVL